jgi:hypothetical protein
MWYFIRVKSKFYYDMTNLDFVLNNSEMIIVFGYLNQ